MPWSRRSSGERQVGKVQNVHINSEGGINSKEGNLADGTKVMYCNPHRRWEWDCQRCGHVNGINATTCDDCGHLRV